MKELIQQSHFNRCLHVSQQRQCIFTEVLVYIQHHVTDCIIGFKVLSKYVYFMLAQLCIDLRKHSRHIMMNVQNTVCAFLRRQCKCRYAVRTCADAFFEVIE